MFLGNFSKAAMKQSAPPYGDCEIKTGGLAMKDATLGQAEKILSIIKGTPSEQVQAILESGLLADLRDGNIGGVNRDEFRKILGLGSLESIPEPLLELIGSTMVIPAMTEKFVAREKFVRDTSKKARVKISYLGDNFSIWFLGKIEESFGGSTLWCGKLRKASVDAPILSELGGEAKAETSLTEMFALMEKQANGEDGILLTNGYANIFYIRDINDVLRAVGCSWNDDGWFVDARFVEYPSEWGAGRQVFSRNPSVS